MIALCLRHDGITPGHAFVVTNINVLCNPKDEKEGTGVNEIMLCTVGAVRFLLLWKFLTEGSLNVTPEVWPDACHVGGTQ